MDRLTGRQREIVICVTKGLTNRQIAYTLGITYGTVKQHMSQIFERTGLCTRTELAVLAVREMNMP